MGMNRRNRMIKYAVDFSATCPKMNCNGQLIVNVRHHKRVRRAAEKKLQHMGFEVVKIFGLTQLGFWQPGPKIRVPRGNKIHIWKS